MLIVMCLGVAVCLILAGAVTWAGNRAVLRPVDCIIVPGAMVDKYGRPGRMLAARIRNAVRLYDEGWAHAIIFTGGRGASGPIESEAARDMALALGVPDLALFVEVESHTTWENFHHARAVMRARGWRSCLVSTDPFHILRCLIIARDMGLQAWPAPAFQSPGYGKLDVRLFYTARECVGLLRYAIERMRPTGPGRGRT